jgi:hypothetical protein
MYGGKCKNRYLAVSQGIVGHKMHKPIICPMRLSKAVALPKDYGHSSAFEF